MRLVGLRRFVSGWLFVGAYNVLQIASCIAAVIGAHRARLRTAFEELGLRGSFCRAVTFSFVAGLPMLVTFWLSSRLNTQITVLSVAVGCFLAPFAEEVLFRGYMFGQLYRRARWGFWLSAIVPSALFALGHAYQSRDPLELLGIFAVTGIGGLLGCWLYLRWNGSLWFVFCLHALMNLWWEIFGVAETALGGWIANAARLATIALAILLTIYKDRLWKTGMREVDWRSENRSYFSKLRASQSSSRATIGSRICLQSWCCLAIG
jgi:membrane protease YdiL (CAAX protease family)